MGSSIVEICNAALDAVGQEPITALTDGTRAAGLCSRYYPRLRDEVLRAHSWNFAIARASLAADTAVPEWGFGYAYQLPADCLRVLQVGEDETLGYPWQVEGVKIVTDRSAPINIRYIRRVEASGDFDPMFVTALAARMAVELAIPLTDSASLRDAMQKAYLGALRTARSADGQEGTPVVLGADEFVVARL